MSQVPERIPLRPTMSAEARTELYKQLLPPGVDRRPSWLTVKLPMSEGYNRLHALMRNENLNTVCEEAMCPNIADCWGRGTATFMILGDVCTRHCAFCAVKSGKRGGDIDTEEPMRVARAVEAMGIRHAVVTSVDRDDLPDFGAGAFRDTITAIRSVAPTCSIEVLTPDFQGDESALQIVMDVAPDIFNHNIETVPRLYRRVRPKADYQQSLSILKAAKRMQPQHMVKSGIMVGLGEEINEVKEVLQDLRRHDVDIVTIGQYLRPSLKHHPVIRFVHPDEFAELREYGTSLGFSHTVAGPLVRSSYHAEEQVTRA
ncbi:MAG: lipoyl synthase [Candidatus Dormibacteria bacterium]